MSGTCISHIMRASVRPFLGHGISIETSISVWDMHWPRDVSQCKTYLGHVSATRCVNVRPCLGHDIGTDMLEPVEDHVWDMASALYPMFEA
ncbi:F-box/WD repeat-containing lin-23 [Gossypium arboreum]|uniref:F-box/WD repeat-containing lin-23 n=1 Tax=Gossypium arboreum TaxID=29729 RepID=A0A0B0P185_GOSAR|nr:F-box/WD repeat-containing lin-23 [Gossypium arboreum]